MVGWHSLDSFSYIERIAKTDFDAAASAPSAATSAVRI